MPLFTQPPAYPRIPPIPEEMEQRRIEILQKYLKPDTAAEVSLENIAELAAESCDVPLVLISLIDAQTQWVLASYGTDLKQFPRNESLCAFTIVSPYKSNIIHDLRSDSRFQRHPALRSETGIRFYAGFPVTTSEGYCIGTLCVMDTEARDLSRTQQKMLKMYASQVMTQLELTSKVKQLESTQEQLEGANEELRRFAYVVAHDINAPLKNILSLSSLLKDQSHIPADALEMLGYIERSSQEARELVEGILEYTLAGRNGVKKGLLELEAAHEQVRALLHIPDDVTLHFESEVRSIYCDPVLLRQILLNLITNAIRYGDKAQTEIRVKVKSQEPQWIVIEIEDNGPGMQTEQVQQVFEPFRTYSQPDRFGRKGSGIGLATVRSLVEKLGGSIKLESAPGKGCRFSIQLPQ
jgi:signal transduction histidine kinase